MAIVLPLDDQKAMCAFVDRRHPAFHEHLAHWEFCESTYEGGRQWFIGNIHKYLKEGASEFNDRLVRAYRFNHSKEVVSLVTKYIFKEGVIRNTTDASEALQKFWKNATLGGVSIDGLMKQVSGMSSVSGRVWVAVDTKKADGAVLTKADEKAGKSRTYAYLIEQHDVLDFSKDEYGELDWILYRMKFRDDIDPVNSSGAFVPRFMLWTREEYILLEERIKSEPVSVVPVIVLADGVASAVLSSMTTSDTMKTVTDNGRQIVVIQRASHELGVVPIFPSDHIENTEPYAPAGLIDEIAYLDKAVANYLSNLDAIIQDQTFSQLIMPAQGMMPGEDSYAKMVEMGTRRIFLYDGEGGSAPQYISPDAAQAGMVMQVITKIIGEIYHSVGMAGERTKQDNASGIDNSSGVAKAYDFERMNALLAAKADMLQRTEERIAGLVELFSGNVSAGVEDFAIDDLIKYPDSYDVRALPDEFDIATNLTLLEAPPTLRRQQMSIIVDKLFPRLAADIKAGILTDLKSWPPDPLETAQAMAEIDATAKGVQGKLTQKTTPAPAGGAKPAAKAASKPAGKSKQGQNNKGA